MVSLTNFFKRKVIYNGIAPDLRSDLEKAKDYHATEIVSGSAVNPAFRTVKKGEWKRYGQRNQGVSNSCVGQTTAKMLEVKVKVDKGLDIIFSASPIYKERADKTRGGMSGNNALDIAVNTGTCKEKDMASQNMTDAQIDALPYPKDYENLNNDIIPLTYLNLPLSFDYVADMIEKQGCAMIWVNTDYASWCKDIPTAGGKKNEVVHSITGVDTFTYNGVQYILVEDSWGEFGEFHGQRLLTREFFNDAVFYSAVFMTFTYEVDNSIKFTPFNVDLAFGQSTPEVKRYQQFLQAKGYFPKESNCTGYFGEVTRKANLKFQIENKVASMAELQAVNGKKVGAKTRLVVNQKL